MGASILFGAVGAMLVFCGGFVLGAASLDSKIDQAGFRVWAYRSVSLALVGVFVLIAGATA